MAIVSLARLLLVSGVAQYLGLPHLASARLLWNSDLEFPQGQNTSSHCTRWLDYDGSETCEEILDWDLITVDQFVQWNPSLSTDCSGLTAGRAYCVEASEGTPPQTASTFTTFARTIKLPTTTLRPSVTIGSRDNGVETPVPTQPGIVDNCSRFHLVRTGDTCVSIATRYGISTIQVVTWNNLNSVCSNIWANTYACVGLIDDSSPPPTTTEPTNPDNGIYTPLPTQLTIVSNCYKFEFVQKDETCGTVAQRAGISANDLRAWNPSLGSDCRGLWANTWACVGVFSSIPSYEQHGCYFEAYESTGAGDNRALSHSFVTNHPGMTVQFCALFCLAGKGQSLFGVENGSECWCGSSLNMGAVEAPASECSKPCNGNESQTCGNGNRLNVYGRSGSAKPISYRPFGCYTEGPTGRALGQNKLVSDSMTIEMCAKFCIGDKVRRHFNVQNGNECFCGTNLGIGVGRAPTTECNVPCAGNKGQDCGGGGEVPFRRFSFFSTQWERPPRGS